MSFLKGLLWFLFGIVLIAIAMYVTGNYALADYLTSVFLAWQPYLPLELDFDQFLVAMAVLSLLIVLLAVAGSAGMLLYMGGRLALAKRRQAGQQSAALRADLHLQEQHQRDYEELLAVSTTLTKELDKATVVQRLVEAASRMTSTPQTNSAASLWLLDVETDTLRFEVGRYCDATHFTQTEYQHPAEKSPFSRVIDARTPWLLPSWEDQLEFVRKDKLAALGSATGAMMIPFFTEDRFSGALLVFCHPDVLKSYDERRAFYEAAWGELAIGLAVAVRGETAILDRLTGALNREYFMRRLIEEIDRSNRFQLPLSLLMIDIDNFKLVNDTLGHPQGDAVLKIIVKLIRKEIRAVDLLGRYGGEEFIVLLPETGLGEEAASVAGALTVAERIRQAVEEEFRYMRKPLILTVSVGVVVRRVSQDRGMDHRELIRLADEQLYRSKSAGKNKVSVYVAQTPQPTG